MNEKELMYDAFSVCQVLNGTLTFLRSYTEDELRTIYNKFSADLLDYKIPHCRIVGVKFSSAVLEENSMIRRLPNYGCSRLDFLHAVRNIIPNKIGGNNVEDICFVNEKQEIPTTGMGWDSGINWKVLKVPTEQMGQLYFGTVHTGNGTKEISTDTIYFGSFFDDSGRTKPRYLIPKVHVINHTLDDMSTVSTYFFFIKGTGIMDFKDTEKLFTKDSGITSCRVKFDLSEFFTCRLPMGGGNSLQLVFTEDIDEMVLTDILREYGKGFGN